MHLVNSVIHQKMLSLGHFPTLSFPFIARHCKRTNLVGDTPGERRDTPVVVDMVVVAEEVDPEVGDSYPSAADNLQIMEICRNLVNQEFHKIQLRN